MFKGLYKQSSLTHQELQEARRNKLLAEQKRKRLELQDEQRNLQICKMPTKHRGPRTLQEAYGSDISLQLSEWLREKPEELGDWFLVPCPRGQRCLVVAHGERTEMYNKAGRRRFTFRSLLPGDRTQRKSTTILDCIYVQEQDAFYVLDVLTYGNQNMLECEAQFRFFWLRSKFDEEDGLGRYSRQNEKIFHLLAHNDFDDAEQVSMVLQSYPLWPGNLPELDGFLLYHKEASYTCGNTPLVCWLFAFMVPDVLGWTVNSSYERPIDYSDPLEYMAEFDAKLALKNKERRSGTKDIEMMTGVGEEMEESECVENATLQDIFNAERALEMEEENLYDFSAATIVNKA